MNREKAIRILSTRDAHGVLCGYTSGVTEALDMAIEALQGGDAEVNETKSPYMQQSRHDDGRMTREEAIKIIDCYDIGFYDLSGEKIPADKLADAFDMAIEALSAEAEWIPCDTSGMPPEGEAVLMSDGKSVWIDETVAWWGNRSDWIGTAWMPLPKPYKGAVK